MPEASRAGWFGQKIITTSDPQRLAPENQNRTAWRAYGLDAAAQAGLIGYSSVAGQACIPMPTSSQYPVGSSAGEAPTETNELWYHGDVGSTIGFAEC